MTAVVVVGRPLPQMSMTNNVSDSQRFSCGHFTGGAVSCFAVGGATQFFASLSCELLRLESPGSWWEEALLCSLCL